MQYAQYVFVFTNLKTCIVHQQNNFLDLNFDNTHILHWFDDGVSFQQLFNDFLYYK